jgi:hypothetical protein
MLELLLLSHFMADFPLQTNAIFAAKMKSFFGVLWHVGVVTLVNFVLLLPFLHIAAVWYAVISIFVAHVIMDQMKVYITKKYANTDNILFFLIDQLVHVLTIVFAVQIFGLNSVFLDSEANGTLPLWLLWYYNHNFLLMLSGLIVVTFAGGILLYFMTHKKQKIKIIFQYNYPQMLARGLLYLLVILIGWIVIGLFNHELSWLYAFVLVLFFAFIYIIIRFGHYLTKNDGMFTDTNYKFNIYFPLGAGIFVLFMIQFIYSYV